MNLPLKCDERFTYQDYLTWDTQERYELIDGVPYMMAPGPTAIHQKVVLAIASQLEFYLKGKSCEVFSAPFDVRLNADESDDTVVQPDVLVVCDASKIEKAGVKGAPDLVVEVLSPRAESYDSTLKLEKYMKAGVKECWLVDIENRIVRVHMQHEKDENQNEEAFLKYIREKRIPVGIFPGFSVDLEYLKI
jgi:Uma2 family endonuclease